MNGERNTLAAHAEKDGGLGCVCTDGAKQAPDADGPEVALYKTKHCCSQKNTRHTGVYRSYGSLIPAVDLSLKRTRPEGIKKRYRGSIACRVNPVRLTSQWLDPYQVAAKIEIRIASNVLGYLIFSIYAPVDPSSTTRIVGFW